jgi:Survival motor neuron (SMN) interacting protein 1 (SIP1)
MALCLTCVGCLGHVLLPQRLLNHAARMPKLLHCMQAEGVEADAAAYLRAVRAEAARIPHVCTAGARLHPEPEACSAPEPACASALPTPQYEWTCNVIDNFVAARSQVRVASSWRL